MFVFHLFAFGFFVILLFFLFLFFFPFSLKFFFLSYTLPHPFLCFFLVYHSCLLTLFPYHVNGMRKLRLKRYIIRKLRAFDWYYNCLFTCVMVSSAESSVRRKLLSQYYLSLPPPPVLSRNHVTSQAVSPTAAHLTNDETLFI